VCTGCSQNEVETDGAKCRGNERGVTCVQGVRKMKWKQAMRSAEGMSGVKLCTGYSQNEVETDGAKCRGNEWGETCVQGFLKMKWKQTVRSAEGTSGV
jgi:hypothetical protein